MRLNLERLGSGLAGNISATGTGVMAQLLIQLVSVPVLALYWGLETYGVWLVLFTLPAYIALSPLGFIGAAANDMTAAVAQERTADAKRTYNTLVVTVCGLCALVTLGAAWAIFGPFQDRLGFAAARLGESAYWAALLLVAYGALAMIGGTIETALRASGAFAKGTYLMAITLLVEAALALTMVIGGGGILEAAAGFVAGRALGVAVLILLVRREAGGLWRGRWHFSFQELRRLAPAALALVMLPLGFALSLQGVVVIIAAVAGPAAVPAFTAVRTLTRTGLQLTVFASTASMPNFTVANAQEDHERREDLVAFNLTVAIALLLPGFVALLLFGQWFVELWSGGTIQPPFLLIALMGGAMVLGALWLIFANLILATNQHASYSYAFVIFSLSSLLAAYLLVRAVGVSGAAMSVLCLEAAMLAWLLLQARRFGLLGKGSLLSAPARGMRFVRGRLPGLLKD